MANKVLWSPDSPLAIFSAVTTTIASGANVVSNEFDNSTAASARRQYGLLEWTPTMSAAPSASDYVNFYVIYALNGANYEDLVTRTTALVASVPLNSAAAAQRLRTGLFTLLPYKFKVVVEIKTASVTVSSTAWSLSLYEVSDEVQ